MARWRRRFVLAAVALFACPATASATEWVEYTEDGFYPAAITVDAGETVHFDNEGGTAYRVTSSTGLFDSGPLSARGAYSMSLAVPGVHRYRSDGPGGHEGVIRVRGDRLGGDDADSAQARIPDIPFPVANAQDVGVHPSFGIKASRTRILLGLTPEATVGQANQAIADAAVRIVGGRPQLGILLVEVGGGGWWGFQPLEEALAALRAAPGIDFASMSTAVEGTAAPRRADAITMGIAPGWNWDEPVGKGNNGLVVSQFPEAWNLLEPIKRKHPAIITGVIDEGFEAHDDLPGLQIRNELCTGADGCRSIGNVPSAHGNHVAGIIGAAYDNDAGFPKRSLGVSGGNPVAKMHGYSAKGFASIGFNPNAFDGAYVLDRQIELLDLVLRSRPPEMRVINHSMTGVKFDPAQWKEDNLYTACGPGAADDDLKVAIELCHPNNSDRWQRELANMGKATAAVLREASRQGVLIVQAAGNAGASFCAGGPCAAGQTPDPIDAAANTEIGWAARHWQELAPGLTNPVLTVQNTAANGAPSADSAINADISAPGDAILSTVLNNGYGGMRGTSMAAPQVAAAAGLLLADDPAMPLQTVRRRLLDWGGPRPGAGSLQFGWTMPDRMNRDDNGDSLVDYPTQTSKISPSKWSVDLDACGASVAGTTIGTFQWAVDGQPVGTTTECSFRWNAPAEGTFAVTLTATGEGGVTESVTNQVKVEDVLIVSVGDSIASGEGNPDIESPFSRWQEDRCHRSAFAGPAQAARTIEQEDARTSVTFVHLACSGARMRGDVEEDLQTIKLGPLGVGGLLTPYEGVTEDDTDSVCAASRRTSPECEPPQLEAAKAMLGDRQPDALTISIGANDMIFSKILMACMKGIETCTTSEGGKGLFDNRIVRLEERYYAVAQKIKELWPNLDSKRVLITQYPDLTQDETGAVNLSCGAGSGISQSEAEWAADTVLPALNGKVAAAAAAHGWTLAAGIPNSFHRHGYCSSDSWIVDVSGSFVFQGGKDGAFHPNYQGHRSYSNFILQALRPELALPAAVAPSGPRDRAPRLNAFRSLAAGGAATRLADVNDRSRDGNRRIVRAVTAEGTSETPDTQRGLAPDEKAAPDGRVDMRDLRRYRDAWLQRCLTDGEGCPAKAEIALDGDALHPKRDLNFDGCVTDDPDLCGAREHAFSRFDLNGDTLIDPFKESLVPWKGDGGAAPSRADALAMSDLDVLEAAWTGGEGAEAWTKSDLQSLLRSADVTVQAGAVLDTGAAKADLQLRTKSGEDVGPKRTLRRRDGEIVMTVPVSNVQQELELVSTASTASGTQRSTSPPFTLKYGEDKAIAVCPEVSLKAMPSGIPADGTSTSTITATVHRCQDREITDLPVTWTLEPAADGATIQPVGPTTDAGGRAQATFTAGTKIAAYTVKVSVDMGEGAEPLESDLVIKTVPKIKVKYLWKQTMESWSESGTTRWNAFGTLLPDCLTAGVEYCIDSFQVGMDATRTGAVQRAGTLTGGGSEFKISEALSNHQGASASTWHLTFNDGRPPEDGHKNALWSVTDPTAHTDKDIDGLTAADEPGGIRLQGLQAVGDLPYHYRLVHAGGSDGVDPIEGHSANSGYFLIPQGGDRRIRFAAHPEEDVVFARQESGFKSFTSCGLLDEDLSTQPGYYEAGLSDYIPGATTIGRKTTFTAGDRPLPAGPGRLKVRYQFAAVAAYEGQPLGEPVLPDCSTANPPSADFEVVPGKGDVAKEGRQIGFKDRSTDPDNDISKLVWDFGDGKTGTGAAPFHMYEDDGTYEVTLTVTDAKGNSDEITRDVVVANEAPEAEITEATAQVNKLTLRYRMLDPGSVDKKQLRWKITSSNPAFPPAEGVDHAGVWWRGPYEGLPAGTYPLTLTVTDKDGESVTDDAVVVVTEQPPPPPPPAPTQTFATCDTNVNLDSEERDFLDLVNEYREDNGLPLVQVSATLTRAAERHADEMAAKDYMAHDGKDGSTPASRAWDAGYPRSAGIGENLAQTETASESLWAWRGSSTGHNENMLNPAWRAIGIARKQGGMWRWATSYGTAMDCPGVPPSSNPAAGNLTRTPSADGVAPHTEDAPEVRSAERSSPAPAPETAWSDGALVGREPAPSRSTASAAAADEPAKPLYGPTAAVTIPDDDALAGRPLQVVNRSRNASGAPIAATFDYGDGSASSTLGADASEQHAYPAQAYWDRYQLDVTAKDAQQRTASTQRRVEVWPDNPPDLYVRPSAQIGVAEKPYDVVVDVTDPRRYRSIPGLELSFTLGDQVVKATTNDEGRAKATVKLLPQAGEQRIQIDFAGTDRWKATSDAHAVWVQVNHAPVAKIGGPYVVGEGEPIKIDGLGSSDPDPPDFSKIETYRWDLDADGQFDDATGRLPAAIGPEVYRDLMCGGTACAAGQAYPIALQVTDTWGDTGTATSKVTFVADFDLLLRGESVTVVPGQQNHYAVNVIGSDSYDKPVTLSAIDLPPGVTATWSKNPVTPTDISVLTLTATGEVDNGTFPIKVRGVDPDGLTKEISNELTVGFGLTPICAGQFAGTITDSKTGAPLSGATVSFLYGGGSPATTDASGRYVIENVTLGWNNAPASYTMVVRAGGHWRKTGDVTVSCGAVPELNLALLDVRKGTVRGKVVDKKTGAVLPDAFVRDHVCVDGDWPCSEQTVAEVGNDGWFEFQPHLALNNASRYTGAVVHAPGYWQASQNILVEEGKTSEGTYELVKKCSGTLMGGTVHYMGEDGKAAKPAAKAGVGIYLGGGFFPDMTVVTDSEGKFTVNRPVELGYNNAPIAVRAHPTPPADAPPNTQGYSGYFNLSSCGQEASVDLLLKSPKANYGALEGTVSDSETGEKIKKVWVQLNNRNRSAQTDDNGYYKFDDVFIGWDGATSDYVSTSVTVDGYHPGAASGIVQKDQTGKADIKIVKKKTGAFTATVVDSVTGAPIPGARIQGDYSCSFLCWISDRNGIASGKNIELATYPTYNSDRNLSLTASAPGYWQQTKATVIKAGQTSTIQYQLQPECAPARISGTVVNAENGNPIHNATVSGGGASVGTNEQGKFLIEGIKPSDGNNPRKVWLTASAGGFYSQSKEITIFCGASITVDFARTSKTGTIHGTVTDGDTGEKLAGAFVGTEFGATATTDAAGNYRIEKVPLGDLNSDREWKVNVKPAGYKAKTQTVVASADTDKQLDFTFNQANVRPLATGTTAELDEDGQKAITVSGSDPDGDDLTYHVMKFPQHGTLSGQLPNVTYTPDRDYNGTDSFEFITSDTVASSETARVDITIKPVNDPPNANSDQLQGLPDTLLRIPAADLLANDSDADGETPTISKVELNNPQAKAEIDPQTGDVLFTPPPGLTSDIYYAFFRYYIRDAAGEEDWAFVYIRVKEGPAAPVCLDRTFTIERGGTLSDTVACTDINGDAVTHTKLTDPEDGQLTFAAGGAFTYTPPEGFVGTRKFTYRGSDGTLESPVRTITINVVPPNAPPVCENLGATGDEDGEVAITLTCTDADVDALALTLVGQPAHGKLTRSAPGRPSSASQRYAYTPDKDWSGQDTFTFRASDGKAQSALATATVTVAPVNDLPGCKDLALEATSAAAAEVAPDCSDVEGDALTYAIGAQPAKGTASVSGGKLRFTPAAGQSGDVTFTYRASDGGGASAPATVAVKVTRQGNAGPVAGDDALVADEDAPLQLPAAKLLEGDSDPEGDPLAVTAVEGAEHGKVALADGTVTFTPDADYNGPARFRYAIADDSGATASGVANVTVRPVNDAPVAADDGVKAPAEGRTVVATSELVANDTDIDGDKLAVSAVSDPANGTVTLNGGEVVFVPEKGYVGMASFRYAVADGAGGTASAAVNVLVGAVKGTEQILGCADRPVVLEDVLPAGKKVKLLGLADPKLAGQNVVIRLQPGNKVVARPVIGASGVFAATVPMPKTRAKDRIRYVAELGDGRSKTLKLFRRMIVDGVKAGADDVTITGRVVGPLAKKKKDRAIEVYEQAVCADGKLVATVAPRADGRFKVVIPRRADQVGAVYRLRSRVPDSKKRGARLFDTFSLPRAVDF